MTNGFNVIMHHRSVCRYGGGENDCGHNYVTGVAAHLANNTELPPSNGCQGNLMPCHWNPSQLRWGWTGAWELTDWFFPSPLSVVMCPFSPVEKRGCSGGVNEVSLCCSIKGKTVTNPECTSQDLPVAIIARLYFSVLNCLIWLLLCYLRSLLVIPPEFNRNNMYFFN